MNPYLHFKHINTSLLHSKQAGSEGIHLQLPPSVLKPGLHFVQNESLSPEHSMQSATDGLQ